MREVLEAGPRGDDEGDDNDQDGVDQASRSKGEERGKKFAEGSLEYVTMTN